VPARPGVHVMSRAARVRRQEQPLGAYLVRVVQERVETVRLRYEVVELSSGERHQFKTLAALNRHLRDSASALQGPGPVPMGE
jgi:hypothetical protein